MTILVCDDDKEIVEAIEIYLMQEGYNVEKAYDGQEALKIVKDKKIDLMIIDVMMPKLDGIRATLQIRRYTTLSSYGDEEGNVYEAGGLLINDDLKKVIVDGEEVKLTPIEYNILLLLLKNKGKVYSINQIYENIWNEEAIGADNTVAVHIRHIREKIEINPKEPRYLKVVWGVGYKIEENL